ncbi:MAG: hypothetical protein GY913_08820 [Proteobacteria bacterium]|nr:hypothetical protein [Pseudomonadota bacterium]MCP4917013.1 hypothetical protein [Pseudomonadota bacterium]
MLNRIQKWAHRASSLSVIVFAIGFAPTVAYTGGPLAMGYWLYNGWTEPEPAELPFPWIVVVLLVVGSIGSLVAELVTGRQKLSILTHGLALSAMGVTAWHLVALIQSSGPPP